MSASFTEIYAAEEAARIKWESETVAAKVDGHDLTINDLRRVFDKVCDQDDWKQPWGAAVPSDLVRVVIAAVQYFHADTPQLVGIESITGRVLMAGNGYQG